MILLTNTHLFITSILLYVSIASQIQENYHSHHHHHHHHHHHQNHHHDDFKIPQILDCQGEIIYDRFLNWVERHNKKYDTPNQNYYRFSIFQKHCRQINQHNRKFLQGESGFTKDIINHFSDLTPTEFSTNFLLGAAPATNTTYHFGYISLLGASSLCTSFPNRTKTLPTSVDWRSTKIVAVTPVKNQGYCGSCWAFSTTGSVEGIQSIFTKKTAVSLSQQQLVDCTVSYGNRGCSGGNYAPAFKYIQTNGIELSANYPYIAKNGTCKYNSASKTLFKIKKCYNIASIGNSKALKEAVYFQPISVGIQANQNVFQLFSSGLILPIENCGDSINHAVLVTGYKMVPRNGKNYEAFVVKNSWGSSWGMSGYINLSTNQTVNNGNGVCGILKTPAAPAIY